jgi:myo-inositol-1(or 4)-monophosphatase
VTTPADSRPDQHEREVLLALAERLAREAGDLVRGRPVQVQVASTKTSPIDVVTEMDVASEALMRGLLARERPDDGILGEEDDAVVGTSGITWVLDPIDGTVNYLYGIPAYAVSVAAVSGQPDPATWTVLAACVHSVTDGRTWTAALGGGSHLDGVRLRVNPPIPLAESLLGTGFGYVAERRRAQAAVLATVLPQVRDIRRIGSAALDLCTIASGSLDLYYERGLKPWDLAAASLVAAEAGAGVVGLNGSPAGEAMTVAGHPESVARLLPLLEALRADSDEVPDVPRR